MRGRLMSAYTLVVVGVSQVFGSFMAGALAESLGVTVAIGGTAVIMAAGGLGTGAAQTRLGDRGPPECGGTRRAALR